MLAPWKESGDKPRQRIKKQRHHFADKSPNSQSSWAFGTQTGLRGQEIITLGARQPEGPPRASQNPGHPAHPAHFDECKPLITSTPFFLHPCPPLLCLPPLSVLHLHPPYRAFILLLCRCFAPRSWTSSLVTSLQAALWLKSEHGYQVGQAGLRALLLTI